MYTVVKLSTRILCNYVLLRFTGAVSGHGKREGEAERHDGVGAELEQLLGVLADGADARPVPAVPATTAVISEQDWATGQGVLESVDVPGVDEAEGEESRAGPQEQAPAGEHAGQSVASASLFLGRLLRAAAWAEEASPAARGHRPATRIRDGGLGGADDAGPGRQHCWLSATLPCPAATLLFFAQLSFSSTRALAARGSKLICEPAL